MSRLKQTPALVWLAGKVNGGRMFESAEEAIEAALGLLGNEGYSA